ncbi:SigE family RNA polymerase sigma factor [Modestobacter sp. I12A-02628]|uniref:SigE family RNA polymerase sigma factor n=1 Tax=Goekera deserti TaxID=2497753 RepID=A0A7K3WB98_9ACTN|nr:SigE family RNA polymerase sigma factor [Goekera deserti]MPQ97402.1 SigE family RNA polymerase sigma factor [Goekera deserti]NDI47997.1 SigE family RNA polymerase sigma factor [Goekera deserti]NEL53745.1 SigE family RNA polymerase sigma factor [Goekera deserti]
MRGTHEAFSSFVREHSPSLMRTAYLLTGDRGHAEDLAQTALAKAYGHWSRVEAADQPVAYVRRLMVNAHLSWLRRLASTEQVVERVPDPGTDDGHAARALGGQLRDALRELSPRVRTAVVLRFYDDHSRAETARLMGCSVSTVDNHVTRGLAALRRLLADDPELVPARTRTHLEETP